MDVSEDQMLKGWQSVHLTPLTAQRCVLCRQGFSLSGSGGVDLNVYNKTFTSSVGKNWQVGVLKRVYHTVPLFAW